ncbi:nose resistant to fluoxetine protein 6-like [Xylocopa sonorina]|uniref:nose resistant to fluoxetine protein 6-like n=1 Tax=Xylocopa sonorina TaxID=1818115 RepID=UPI00403A8AE2
MEDRKLVSGICLSIICVTCYQPIQASVQHSQAMTEALPAYAMSGFTEYLNLTGCRKEMEEFRQAVDRRTVWALRMLDASGLLPYGFTNGQNYWLGDRIGCKMLSDKMAIRYSEDRKKNNSLYRNPKEEFPPFELNFFTSSIRHDSVLQYNLPMEWENIVVLGLCLPATCTKHEVATMLNRMLDNGTLFADELYSMKLKLQSVAVLKVDDKWLQDSKIIVALFILVSLMAIVIASTLYDVMASQSRSQETECSSDRKENTDGSETRVQVQNENDDKKIEPSKRKLDNGLREYFVCFSLYTNIPEICTMNRNPKHVQIFDGIKTLSVLWVDLIHIIFYTFIFSGNHGIFAHGGLVFSLPVVLYGSVVVDTFFFMSGFFLMRHFQSQEAQQEALSLTAKFEMFLSAFYHRYIRIAPAYYVLLLLAMIFFSWQKQFSLFNEFEITGELCAKYWWRNVLFINSFFEWEDMCMNWTWFLADDMQFFLFTMCLLLLSITIDEFHDLVRHVYTFPWLRISPYLLGVGACILLKKWNYRLNLSKKVVVAIWILAFITQLWVIYGMSIEPISKGYTVFHTATCRTFWALSVGWVVIACITHNAGFIEKILSWEIWYPLNTLAYTAYLVNPVVIIGLYHTFSYPSYMDISISLMFLATTILTYVSALVLTATVEMPFIGLLRVYEKRKAANQCT